MDMNRLASRIVRTATNEMTAMTAKKNPAAVALGKLGGKRGGPARAEKLAPERRKEIAEMAARSRWERYSLYDEVKATQEAAFLLELNGGKMDYAKCTKLLYNIEREALNRWMRPVTFDTLCSLPHGQVLSKALDKAKFENQDNKSFWREHLETDNQNNIRLVRECGKGKLSRAEIGLIKEFDKKYKGKTAGQMMDEHHNPKLFPEWRDPGGSSINTKYSDLLHLLGKTPEQIKEFEQDLSSLKHLKAITR